MKKISTLILASFLLACQTHEEVVPILLDATSSIPSGSSSSCEGILVHLKVYNLQDPDDLSTGYSHTDIEASMATLAANFAPHDISFDYSIIDFPSPHYFTTNPTYHPFYYRDGPYWSELMTEEDSDDFIEIFMFPNHNGTPGFHLYLPETAFAVAGMIENQPVINTNIVTHEMGNVLGLIDLSDSQCEGGDCCVNGHGNYMGDVSSDPIACLDFFYDWQVDNMQQNLLSSSTYEDLSETCCHYSHWSLSGLPGSTLAMGSPVNYVVNEVGSEELIEPNTIVSLRVYAECPLNVYFDGTAHGVPANSYRDFQFNGYSSCTLEPSISLPEIKFYSLTMGPFGSLCGPSDLDVTVKLQSVSAGHTLQSSQHTFRIY